MMWAEVAIVCLYKIHYGIQYGSLIPVYTWNYLPKTCTEYKGLWELQLPYTKSLYNLKVSGEHVESFVNGWNRKEMVEVDHPQYNNKKVVWT